MKAVKSHQNSRWSTVAGFFVFVRCRTGQQLKLKLEPVEIAIGTLKYGFSLNGVFSMLFPGKTNKNVPNSWRFKLKECADKLKCFLSG